MGKTANAIYAGSCSVDLFAVKLMFCFIMMFILAVTQSLIAFIYFFQIRCVLSFKSIYLF